LTVNNREVIDDNDEDANPEIEAFAAALQDDIVSIIGSTNSACRTEFPESDLGDINSYLTNPDASENSFSSALNPFSATAPGLVEINGRTIDVQETTKSFYAMANYETQFGGMPVSGNIGARIVDTDIKATGYRPELIITQEDGGVSLAQGTNLESFTVDHSYTRFLPSAIAIVDIADDKIVRLGAFRAMSRADPADMGAGRTFVSALDEDETAATH